MMIDSKQTKMDKTNWDEILHCSECGSSDVEIMAWVDPNTDKYIADVDGDMSAESCWCDNCEAHTNLVRLPDLWERFSEIGVNDDDEIEQDFLSFKKGTSKYDVWHWFDERCPNGLAKDLMNENE